MPVPAEFKRSPFVNGFLGRRILLLKNPVFAASLLSQKPPALLPRKSACHRTLRFRRIRRPPLFRVSQKQRYNTLDFAEQNRVPTGMLRAPIGNPAPRGASRLSARSALQSVNALRSPPETRAPLDTPFFFTQRSPNCENAVCLRCEENTKGSIRDIKAFKAFYLVSFSITRLQAKDSHRRDTTVSSTGTSLCTDAIELPCTERYVRWFERPARQLASSPLYFF